jgi:hypothetical protein
MSLCEPLAAELQREAATTRRMLERVPEDKFGWKPHEKSMPLGRLAGHVAELPTLIAPALTQDELDFAVGSFQPFSPTSVAELLERFDGNVAAAAGLLKNQTDERMHETWRLRSREQVFFESPRTVVIRSPSIFDCSAFRCRQFTGRRRTKRCSSPNSTSDSPVGFVSRDVISSTRKGADNERSR